MDVSFLRDSLRLRGIKCFRQRGCGGGLELVHPQAHFLGVGIMLLNQFVAKACPIHLGPLRCDCAIPLTGSWLTGHTKVGDAIALLLCSLAQRLPRLSRERRTDCAKQLGGHCIETPLGTLSLLRVFLHNSDLFHVADTGRLLLGGHTPCLLRPRLQCMFFHVRRLVSCDTASTIAHSTI
jgi:hypothetical protein